jgi:methylmalonyl-CoA/ethylmalonyl-CoA epimerase
VTTETTRPPGSFAPVRRKIVQVAYLVDHLEDAVKWWVATAGAGPFFVVDKPIELDEATHNGVTAIYSHTPAFGQCGDLQIELVKVHDLQPEGLAHAFAPARHAVHHVACFVEDRESEGQRLDDLGIPEVLAVRRGPTTISFHDATPLCGHLIELYPESATETHDLYRRVRAAAQDWDGSDPMRPEFFD